MNCIDQAWRVVYKKLNARAQRSLVERNRIRIIVTPKAIIKMLPGPFAANFARFDLPPSLPPAASDLLLYAGVRVRPYLPASALAFFFVLGLILWAAS